MAHTVPPPTADKQPTVSLKEFLDEKFNALDERFDRVWDRFSATERALDKADESLTAYKQIANEFRGTLKDQAATFVAKDEAERQRLRIDDLEKTSSNTKGKIWMLAAGVMGIQLILNLIQVLLTK